MVLANLYPLVTYETKRCSVDLKIFPVVAENTGVNLESCSAWKSVPTSVRIDFLNNPLVSYVGNIRFQKI